MEDNYIDKIMSTADSIKEKGLIEKENKIEKEEVFIKEVPDKEIEKIVDIKSKAMEIKEQIKKQESLVFKLGLKKRDTALRGEFESLHQEYKQILSNLEAGGFDKKSITEKELKLNISRKKEKQEKEIEKLTPLKSRLFEKLKGFSAFLTGSFSKEDSKENIEKQLDSLEKIKSDLELEKTVKLQEEQELGETVLDEEEISIDGNMAGRFKNFDEEQIRIKKEELENEKDIREESFDTRNIPKEEDVREKYEKIKEEEEDAKEIIEESMDRPNI